MKLDKIKQDLEKRTLDLYDVDARAQKYPEFAHILNADDFICYQLMGVGNETLEDVETLESRFINCFLDDSYICVVRYEHEVSKSFRERFRERGVDTEINWSYKTELGERDDQVGISKEQMLYLFQEFQRAKEFYEANQDQIENRMQDGSRIEMKEALGISNQWRLITKNALKKVWEENKID